MGMAQCEGVCCMLNIVWCMLLVVCCILQSDGTGTPFTRGRCGEHSDGICMHIWLRQMDESPGHVARPFKDVIG